MENTPQIPSNKVDKVNYKETVYTHDFSFCFCVTSNKENEEDLTEAEIMVALKAKVGSTIYADVKNSVEHYSTCDDAGNYQNED